MYILKNFNRWSIYLLGMFVLAAGITLTTKTGLGVSPIISVAFCVSEIFSLNFGDMTFLLYAIFVVIQLFIRDRSERIVILLQLAVSLVFSRVLNLFGSAITYDHTLHGLPVNLAVLAVAIFLTGAGVALSVNMRLVPNPGDGIVQAIAQKKGWTQGFTKNVFDGGCVIATILIGILFARRITGIGLGTLLAMLGVGRAVALVNRFFQEKMLAAAELERFPSGK